MTGLSSELADWAVNFSFEDAPLAVRTNTSLRLLDIVGVIIASNRLKNVDAARNAIALSDAGGHGARALMEAGETSLANAAFINGVASAILEFDDTHIASNIHPTGVVSSAALPVAQAGHVSGRRLLEALLVGSEICCRLGLVSPVRMHEVGFHPTSVYGVFGAAYAVALLQGLAPQQIADAVGTAASLSAGSISAFEDGTDTKTMHVGFAAAAAIRATALAASGISGPAKVFEGKFGWYRSHVQSVPEFRFAALTEGLGERWEVMNIAPKLYPCAYTLIPFIEAALALREQHHLTPDMIAEIRCHIMPRSFHTVCEPVEQKRRPLTSWHGRISLQHTVAEALVLGRFDKNAYAPSSLRDPVINGLADRVIHLPDELAGSDTSRSRAVISITLADGRVVSHTVEDMLGTSRNPADMAVYVRKFRQNVEGVLSDTMAEDLAEQILQLEKSPDVDMIFAALRQ